MADISVRGGAGREATLRASDREHRTKKRYSLVAVSPSETQSSTKVARAVLPLAGGFVLVACAAASQSTAPRSQPARADPISTTPQPTNGVDAKTCASLGHYTAAAEALTFFPTFRSMKYEQASLVLLRPSEDTKRMEEVGLALARADSAVGSDSATARAISSLLHLELDSLRGLLAALQKADSDAYRQESARYDRRRQELFAIAESVHSQCGTRLFEARQKGVLSPAVIQRECSNTPRTSEAATWQGSPATLGFRGGSRCVSSSIGRGSSKTPSL